jgi:hypothetical protein
MVCAPCLQVKDGYLVGGPNPKMFFPSNAPGLVISAGYERGNPAPSLFAADGSHLQVPGRQHKNGWGM